MKLSEAIRLGSMMKPQAFGVFGSGVEAGPVFGDVLGLRVVIVTATCALGAALHAVGHDMIYGDNVMALTEHFSSPAFLSVMNSRCPACDVSHHFLGGNTIAHLNNDHLWTREQIADWVETVEGRAASVVKEHTGEESACVATAVSVVKAT